MKKALFILSDFMFEKCYDEDTLAKIHANFDVIGENITEENYKNNFDLFSEVEVIFSGMGSIEYSKELMEASPNLEAIFYAAGSMRSILSQEVWDRGIVISTANAANAVPVAEFTLSQILFTLKDGWKFVRQTRQNLGKPEDINVHETLGNYKQTVGIISASQIGRKTIELLKPFDLDIILYDPYVSVDEAEDLGVKLVSLDEIFEQSDVVSLHAPWLEETENMITGDHFRKTKNGASFINTARGAIIKEAEMLEVLKERTDITAILDVVYPEPPAKDSLIFKLDNVVYTPHIAGSTGHELARLGAFSLKEALRYINGEPLQYQITEESYEIMA
ncbi:hydroxyacid dehydrogenase [Aerococcaceae bacterium DSM 111022]|nr:hydroxyacid dehydrogenase [Aerococcaceae bacterium DSM 111022]